MVNNLISSAEQLSLDFNSAFSSRKLQENYFIHKYTSPYDNERIVSNEQKNLLLKIRNNITKEQNSEENSTKWIERRKRQRAIMALLIVQLQGVENDSINKEIQQYLIKSDEDLIKILNQEYKQYISQNSVYNDYGYFDIYRLRALKTELSNFYKHFNKVLQVRLDSQKVLSNFRFLIDQIESNSSYSEGTISLERTYKDEALNYIKNRLNALKDDKAKKENEYNKVKNDNNVPDKIKKIKRTNFLKIIDSIKVLNELDKKIQEGILINIEEMTSNSYLYGGTKNKITAQEAGNINEKIFTGILENLFNQGLPNVIVSNTGMSNESIEEGANKFQSKVKTDVRLTIGFNGEEKLDSLLQDIVKSTELEENKTDINFSLKNYNFQKSSFDVHVQSNNNFDSFLNILNNRDRNSPLKFLSDNSVDLKNLRYFLINEAQSQRKNHSEFLSIFKEQCSRLGINLMFALNSETDEVDFLNINQKIIPSYYLHSLISQLSENEVYPFKINIPTAKATADTVKNTVDNLTINSKGEFIYYTDNYLQANREVGINTYKNLRIDTVITKKYIIDIIKAIMNNIGG